MPEIRHEETHVIEGDCSLCGLRFARYVPRDVTRRRVLCPVPGCNGMLTMERYRHEDLTVQEEEIHDQERDNRGPPEYNEDAWQQ